MKTFRRMCACMALGLGVGAGCTIEIGSLKDMGENATAVPGSSEAVPEQPPLDAVQQARKEEADRYTVEVIYKGGTVLASLPLPSGDVIDLVDRNTLPGLPYSLPPLPVGPEAFVLPEGVSFGLTELEQIPDYLELAATAVPFHRPSFWPYILGDAPDAVSIEDYLERYSEGGAPSSSKRLYAGLVSMVPNRGAFGLMNQYRPEVAESSFSLIEFSVSCPADGPAQEQIGIVISVDRYNNFGVNREKYHDGEARLHIEYARTINGKVQYVWDGMDGQFVDNPLRLHHPGEKVPVSVLNESIVEHFLAVFQASSGDWWLMYNGDLLGYYPAGLFKLLNGGACRAAWYGEVLNKKPEGAVLSEMGSGQFAEAGVFKAAYVRNPKYVDGSGFSIEPKEEYSMVPYESLCYNRTALSYAGAPTYSSFMLLGGPGGKNPACKWP